MPTELPAGLLTILGFLAPLVFQFVTRYVKNELARFLVVIVLSAVTGFAAIFFGKYPVNLSVEFISVLFTFATIAYKVIWKPLFNATGVLIAKPTTY